MNFKKRDFVFFLVIFLITSGLFFISKFQKSEHNTVFVYVNGEVFEKLPLDKDAEIDVNGTNKIVIKDNSVYMKEATCPDKLCIKQGKISNSSKNIICLPNKVTVKTNKSSDIDATLK